MLPMSTQEELRTEHERLLEAGDFDAASRILEQLEPLSDDDWRRLLADAPVDDEPLSDGEARRFDEFEAFLSRQLRRQAG